MVLGLAFGLVFGNWQVSISIAVFFELLWLDFFPAGTYIPPHRTFSAFFCLFFAQLLHVHQPAAAVPLILLGMPLSWLGSTGEHWHRVWQNASYDRILEWSEDGAEGDFRPEGLVRNSLLQMFVLQFTLFAACGLVLFHPLQSAVAYWQGAETGLTWHHLWILGMVGGILSLRIRRAFEFLIIGGVILCLAAWL